MKKTLIRVLGLFIVLFGALTVAHYYFNNQTPPPEELPKTVEPSPAPKPKSDMDLKQELLAHLNKEDKKSKTLRIPRPKKPRKISKTPVKLKKPKDDRAKGREKRKHLPLGVILWDKTKAFKDKTSRKSIYTMTSGDFVRVFSKEPYSKRVQVQPGVDLYLAATSKQFEAAGHHLPDKSAWVERNQIQIFNPKQAIEFTQGTAPMTLGLEPTFSSLAFYERAMKNTDPVVHRVIGPRLIELVSLHEDYSSSWKTLYRDPDSKIRSVCLAVLKERGIGNNRPIIEDLIKRLAELTRVRVQGESEAEALSILGILEDSQHPRIPAALQGFIETWSQTQNQPLLTKARSILKTP